MENVFNNPKAVGMYVRVKIGKTKDRIARVTHAGRGMVTVQYLFEGVNTSNQGEYKESFIPAEEKHGLSIEPATQIPYRCPECAGQLEDYHSILGSMLGGTGCKKCRGEGVLWQKEKPPKGAIS